MYRDIFDSIMEDINDLCECSLEVRNSLKPTKRPTIDNRDAHESYKEYERETREMVLRMAGTLN